MLCQNVNIVKRAMRLENAHAAIWRAMFVQDNATNATR